MLSRGLRGGRLYWDAHLAVAQARLPQRAVENCFLAGYGHGVAEELTL